MPIDITGKFQPSGGPGSFDLYDPADMAAGELDVALQLIAGGSILGGSHATAPAGELVAQRRTDTGAPSHSATEGTLCWNTTDDALYVNNNGTTGWTKIANNDHGGLGGLGDDDHTQYALLAGRSGGQSLIGGTASGNGLTLQSTSHATKGKILFGSSGYDEVNNRLGILTQAPDVSLHIAGGGTAPSFGASVISAFVRATATDTSSRIAIIAGNAAVSGINFGDTDDEDVASLVYNHSIGQFAWTVETVATLVLTGSVLKPGSTGLVSLGQSGNVFASMYANFNTASMTSNHQVLTRLSTTARVERVTGFSGDVDPSVVTSITFVNGICTNAS